MLKVLKDIETNTCDKEFMPNTAILDKKLDRIIELHQEEIALLKKFTDGKCTCGKHSDKHHKEGKKSKKDKKVKKERDE